MDFNQIVLTLIVLSPVTAAVIILLTPRDKTMFVRVIVAMLTGVATFKAFAAFLVVFSVFAIVF